MRRTRSRALLALVGLADRERNRPPQLSGGERQRVAVARAIANEPMLLLADEPTGSLDSDAGRIVLDLLERIRHERATTLILVTHDPGVAARADRVVEMLDGRLARGRPAPVEAEIATRIGSDPWGLTPGCATPSPARARASSPR